MFKYYVLSDFEREILTAEDIDDVIETNGCRLLREVTFLMENPMDTKTSGSRISKTNFNIEVFQATLARSSLRPKKMPTGIIKGPPQASEASSELSRPEVSFTVSYIKQVTGALSSQLSPLSSRYSLQQ